MELIMQLVIDAKGTLRCVYSEMIDLTLLGSLSICRASRVESDDLGQWWADLSAVGGPTIGPFPHRSEALAAEASWLEKHWLPHDQM
jgi:hypothetical protein